MDENGEPWTCDPGVRQGRRLHEYEEAEWRERNMFWWKPPPPQAFVPPPMAPTSQAPAANTGRQPSNDGIDAMGTLIIDNHDTSQQNN